MSDSPRRQLLAGQPITACEVTDCHAHLGPPRRFFSAGADPAGMLRTMDRLGIRMAAISACPAFFGGDAALGNDLTAAAVRGHPDLFIGYCVVNGNYPGEVRGEPERCFERLGLGHIKLHPSVDNCSIEGKGYADVWPFAAERGAVVLIHTWQESPATPAACARIAERYPRLEILLGHAGGPKDFVEAARIAHQLPNVFLDTVLSVRRLGSSTWWSTPGCACTRHCTTAR